MEIESCPFCGGDKLEVGYDAGDEYDGNLWPFFVACKNFRCGIRGPWASDEGEAMKKWNERVDEKVKA